MYWLVKFNCVPFLKLSKIVHAIVLLIFGSHIVHVDKSEMLLHDYYDFVSEDQQ